MKKIKKHFLLSVSKDTSHQYGVRFLSYFFQNKNDVLVDILNVAHTQNPAYSSYGTNKSSSLKNELTFLEEVKQKMIDFGFPSENIRTESRQSSISTVRDIIAYGRKGLYDSLILGRRGLTLLENLIQDSVSSRILDEQCDIPIWICREPERHKKHLLVCTDGSQQSLNTADHVGFVLGAAPENNITVLHVKSRKNAVDEQQVFDRTISHIMENGIPRDRISTLTLEGDNAARVILDHARKNNFSVIAMGRKCQTAPRTGLARFFVGSVSGEVLNKLEGTSLWICK
jgi:nucleotide-binding universal stress UspA family protein